MSLPRFSGRYREHLRVALDAALALLGAFHGADALPADWRSALASCRPLEAREPAHHPRPPACWPVDAAILAERLLALGSERSH